MILSDAFTFSQSSLQDFVDCRRRFQLRYLQHAAWPALQSEPALEAERFAQQGAAFHRLVQQLLTGLPVERLEPFAAQAGLEPWWQSFTQAAPHLAGIDDPSSLRLYPEITLTASLGKHRLLAKYDLLRQAPDGKLTIFDWKTSRQRTQRKWLAARLQTRLYPYLLVRAGAFLNAGNSLAAGNPLTPEQVEMVYWFAADPHNPEIFTYSQAQLQDDEQFLTGLVDTVQSLPETAFFLTADERHCRYCVYRSLCNRGASAGDLADFDAADGEIAVLDLDLDFENLPEISF